METWKKLKYGTWQISPMFDKVTINVFVLFYFCLEVSIAIAYTMNFETKKQTQ